MRNLWRKEETETLKTLLARGLDTPTIARRMNRPLGSVASHMHIDGLRTTRPINIERIQRPWTESEIDLVLDMRDAEKPFKEIMEATGRARSAIQKKIKSLDTEYLRRRRAKKHAAAPLPVAQSDWMQPLTRAQLMAGHA